MVARRSGRAKVTGSIPVRSTQASVGSPVRENGEDADRGALSRGSLAMESRAHRCCGPSRKRERRESGGVRVLVSPLGANRCVNSDHGSVPEPGLLALPAKELAPVRGTGVRIPALPQLAHGLWRPATPAWALPHNALRPRRATRPPRTAGRNRANPDCAIRVARRGRCWDDARAESLFATSGNERAHQMSYLTKKGGGGYRAVYRAVLESSENSFRARLSNSLEVRVAHLNTKFATGEGAQTPMGLSAIDLFCGAGGLSAGFAQEGYDLVLGIDSDRAAVETYAANFGSDRAEHADLLKYTASDVRKRVGGKVDVILGGPSCQPFSTHGRRQRWVVGDPRSDLWSRMFSHVDELRPRAFVMGSAQRMSCFVGTF